MYSSDRARRTTETQRTAAADLSGTYQPRMTPTETTQPFSTAAGTQTAPGTIPTPAISAFPTSPVTPGMMEGPPMVSEVYYTPGYLATLIGKFVRAEFIIGTNQYIDKTGVLINVGVNFFVLRDPNFGTSIMCDLYSMKFITVYS
jgi:hypothetical protein